MDTDCNRGSGSEMKLYHFVIFHNWRGVFGVTLSAALAWVIVGELLKGRDRDWLWVWGFLTSTWAAVTDRIKSNEMVKAHVYFVEVSMFPEQQEYVDPRTRLSVFGVPLSLYPTFIYIFAIIIPLVEGNPLPPFDFYRDGIICIIGSGIVYLLMQPLREISDPN